MDVVRRGLPVVVAGADRLDVPVRWVHAVEVTDDVARLLRGGELILSTGIALPESDSALASYVAELAAAGVAGLAIELGRRYSVALPPALVAAAALSGVVLIEFRAEVAFVELTEAVHTRIFEARAQLPDWLQRAAGPHFARLLTRTGTPHDLPRPRITPVQVRERFMQQIAAKVSA